jgi:hypothetical protein
MQRQMRKISYLALILLVGAVCLFCTQASGQVKAYFPLTPTPETPTLLKSEFNAAEDGATDERSGLTAASVVASGTDTSTPVADTEIIQGYPTSNCIDELEIHAGYDTYLNPDGRIVRGLVRFNLTGIRPGATINSATLRLYLVGSYDYAGHSIAISPYRVSSPWAEDMVNWNDRPSIGESYPATWITHGAWGWYEFDVTNLVRGWVNGTYPNYGLFVRGPESSAGWRAFATDESIYPPQLVVDYAQSPDFALALVPNSHEVSKGESASSILYVTGLDGFDSNVTLSLTGLPTSVTYEWQANPVVPTGSTLLTITTAADTPSNAYDFTVMGNSGALVHSVQGALGVDVTSGPIFSNTVYLPLILKKHQTVGSSSYPQWYENLAQGADTIEASTVSRVALVVGISDYEHMEPAGGSRAGAPGNDLRYGAIGGIKTDSVYRTRGGCCGSTGAVATQDFGCNITLFLDAQATKAEIHAAIVNWLDPLENENTIVTIYFSGHGMYAPDDDGDENDPYDEFLVPYEIQWDDVEKRWLYEMAIRDDELASWLDLLESRNIAILVDSCFSGGMMEAAISRTGMSRTRGLAWQPASHGMVSAAQWQNGLAQDIQGPGRVILTASTESQASWEFGELEDGVFTYYLREAFRSSSADTNSNGWISAEEAYTYLAGRVDSYVYSKTGKHQNPQISDGVTGQVDLIQLPGIVGSCPAW